MPWAGPAVVASILVVHLVLSANRAREARIVPAVGALEFVVDSAMAFAGLYAFTYPSVSARLSPPWMVALWMIFATTLSESTGWLSRNYRLAAALGAICGPLSYEAAARLGAIRICAYRILTFGGIALVWVLAMPTLLWIRDALAEHAGPARVREAARAT